MSLNSLVLQIAELSLKIESDIDDTICSTIIMLPNIEEQESKIVFLSKKSVSFNAKIDVLYIPTRIEMSQKYMNGGN